ncbi:MAG: NAD(P)-dependent oxidoreductase [Candidatus Omnitrophica bacterium]|nr:NAD(P)-dependent oxidoreductase [Candidatus Omnitrophota bacterium]
MKIVITGALGYIGSKLIQEIQKKIPRARLILIDNLMTRNQASLSDLPGHVPYEFHKIDVLHDDLSPYFQDAQFAVHLAAAVDPQNYPTENLSNHRMTQRVAEECLKNHTTLIFPSTTSVYGVSHPHLCESEDSNTVHPQTPYAHDKRISELYFHGLAAEGLRFVIFRFATIFGVSPGLRYQTAIGKFCQDAVMNHQIAVWSSALHQYRPYLDLEDAVQAILFALTNQLDTGEIFNLASLHATAKEVLDLIACSASFETKLVPSPLMNNLSYQISCEKICRKGFVFRGNLEAGIRDTIDVLRYQESDLFNKNRV